MTLNQGQMHRTGQLIKANKIKKPISVKKTNKKQTNKTLDIDIDNH